MYDTYTYIHTSIIWYPHILVAVLMVKAEPSSLQNPCLVVECCNGMTLRSSCRWPPHCQALLPHRGSSRNRSSSKSRRNLSWSRVLSWRHHYSGSGWRTMTCGAQCAVRCTRGTTVRIPVSRFAMDHGTGISGAIGRATVIATSACGQTTDGSGVDTRLWI